MSTMEILGQIALGDILDRIEQLGGIISWSGDRPGAKATCKFLVELDAQEAFDALPTRYFDDWQDEQATLIPDPRDVRDFVGACLGGDRHLAVALVPRVVGTDSAQDAAERALRTGGRA